MTRRESPRVENKIGIFLTSKSFRCSCSVEGGTKLAFYCTKEHGWVVGKRSEACAFHTWQGCMAFCNPDLIYPPVVDSTVYVSRIQSANRWSVANALCHPIHRFMHGRCALTDGPSREGGNEILRESVCSRPIPNADMLCPREKECGGNGIHTSTPPKICRIQQQIFAVDCRFVAWGVATVVAVEGNAVTYIPVAIWCLGGQRSRLRRAALSSGRWTAPASIGDVATSPVTQPLGVCSYAPCRAASPLWELPVGQREVGKRPVRATRF